MSGLRLYIVSDLWPEAIVICIDHHTLFANNTGMLGVSGRRTVVVQSGMKACMGGCSNYGIAQQLLEHSL